MINLTLYILLLSLASNSLSGFGSSLSLLTRPFLIVAYFNNDMWNILFILYFVVVLAYKLVFLLHERLERVRKTYFQTFYFILF